MKLIYALGAAAALLLARNLYYIFMVVPDEASQGMIYRIMYFHVPSWWSAFSAVFLAALASAGYLASRNLRWDSLAVATTEVALAFFSI
ncbi:MAG: hypothetical protein FJW37_13560, partial [Acidobacteria bacterium]|nr:hypothetical protein [Acidobacteriota bacterium]